MSLQAMQHRYNGYLLFDGVLPEEVELIIIKMMRQMVDVHDDLLFHLEWEMDHEWKRVFYYDGTLNVTHSERFLKEVAEDNKFEPPFDPRDYDSEEEDDLANAIRQLTIEMNDRHVGVPGLDGDL